MPVVNAAGDDYDRDIERHRADWGKAPLTPAEQHEAQMRRIADLRRQRRIEIYGDWEAEAAREFRNEQISREIAEQYRADQAAEFRARLRKNLALADEVTERFKRGADEDEIARELKLSPATVSRILENVASRFDE